MSDAGNEKITLYRRPKFIEVLHEVRRRMADEADLDLALLAEAARLYTKVEVDAPAENETSEKKLS